MWRQNFYHALDVHAVGLPAFLDWISCLVENDAIRKRRWAAGVAGDEAIFVEIHEVQVVLREGTDDREARKTPVELHFGKLQGPGDECIRRRIGAKPKNGWRLSAKIEARLVDATRGANYAAPIKERRRQRKRGNTFGANLSIGGKFVGPGEGRVVRDAASQQIRE